MADEADIAVMERSGRRRRRRAIRAAVGTSAVLAVLLGGTWLARKPIAIHFIAQTLRDKGVPGTFEVIRIGPQTQRLERLVLGDPKRPDLTADWVEVDLGYTLFGVRVKAIRAHGVTLQARLRDGSMSFGVLDRLMPKSGGEPALPDINAIVEDTRIWIDSDYGRVEVPIEGTGNLRSGFSGKMAVRAPRLTFGGCALDQPLVRASLATLDGEVAIKGPMTGRALDCSDIDLHVTAPRLDPDLRADPGLKSVTLAMALSAGEARQGGRALTQLSGLITAKGSAEELRGSAALAAERSLLGLANTGPLKIGGNYALRPRSRDQDYSYAATVTAEEIRPASKTVYAVVERQAAGTPLEPLAKKLAQALRSASRANRFTVSGRVSGQGPQMQLLVNGADFAATSGARAALAKGSRLTLNLPKGDWAVDGGLETQGGGLPETRLTAARRADGGLDGSLAVADYRAGTARLGLTPVRFLMSANGALRVNTTVSLDGPIGDGGVRGLEAPVDVTIGQDGRISLPRDCMPVRWTSLRISTASFDPARLTICGLGGSNARIADVALRGRMGESPFSVSAINLHYGLDSGRFDLAALDARMGAGDNPVLLKAGSLDGAVGRNGELSGTLAQGAAIIGAVPLDLSAINGKWTFANSVLSLDGAMRVADRQADVRFFPLEVPNARLTLADGRIDAGGTLVHPASKVSVATVKIGHDLGSGVGQADFALSGLRFGQALQPDDVTPLTLGIVANVEGPVEGAGRISWSGDGVTASTGTFSARDMNFAAAFGPVTGFATTLTFTDLLALRSAPHQRLTMKQVSAGVDVFDGVIDYAVLSTEQAQIEGGRWPFSGGTLELLPATIDFSGDRAREFTFRVVGLDAAAFVNTFQFENLDVHGTLDGLLPMVFDPNGGRIENGILVARQQGLPALVLNAAADPIPSCDNMRQGGSLAYVGAVSNAELGTMGSFAFDALKRFNYRCLVVRLDGALDGEFVTKIQLNGIGQGEDTKHGWLLRPFLKLPIIFNIRIEAPFRKLLGDYQRLSDPNELFRQELEKLRAGRTKSALAVQPADSENKKEGNTE